MVSDTFLRRVFAKLLGVFLLFKYGNSDVEEASRLLEQVVKATSWILKSVTWNFCRSQSRSRSPSHSPPRKERVRSSNRHSPSPPRKERVRSSKGHSPSRSRSLSRSRSPSVTSDRSSSFDSRGR
eukprot:TRINITY_DN974_c1_g1_i11.p1 TRINITY_DN974_c1_g1~~TRINITY_DN974_c1_g1_i11.p1  ORF type:complete len:125 (+),score=11.65 TRINITY_DN974_c1_g1_i11:2485-2859(+)